MLKTKITMELDLYKKARDIRNNIDKYQRVIMDLNGGGTITVERNNVKSDLTYDENIRQAMLTALRSEVEKLEIKFKAL